VTWRGMGRLVRDGREFGVDKQPVCRLRLREGVVIIPAFPVLRVLPLFGQPAGGAAMLGFPSRAVAPDASGVPHVLALDLQVALTASLAIGQNIDHDSVAVYICVAAAAHARGIVVRRGEATPLGTPGVCDLLEAPVKVFAKVFLVDVVGYVVPPVRHGDGWHGTCDEEGLGEKLTKGFRPFEASSRDMRGKVADR